MPDIPNWLMPIMVFVSYGLTAVIVAGTWWGAGRAGLAPGERRNAAIAVAVVLLAWQTGMLWLAQRGAFINPADQLGPQIAFAILLPIPIALAFIARSSALTRVVAAVPLSALVGVQLYRTLGAVFLILWWGGQIPGEFALPAGIGDVLVGLAAVGVAGAIASEAAGARRLTALWNTLGAADLVVAVIMGFLTSPGLFQMFALDAPNRLVSAFPLALVPLYAVPVSFILHALVWQRLRADRARWNEAVAT